MREIIKEFIKIYPLMFKEDLDFWEEKVLELFKTMKKSSYFINISRGAIVNEDDLITALNNKIIQGAALDVFQTLYEEFTITPSHASDNADSPMGDYLPI